jgi:hypothetical protein
MQAYILKETGQTYQGCCIDNFFFNLILDHVTDLEYLQWSPFLPAGWYVLIYFIIFE